MMETRSNERKWTPGPWKWVKPNHWPDYGSVEQALGGFEAGHTTVCDFGHNAQYYPSEGKPPNEADAHLIAAAPDLYEALDKVDRWFSGSETELGMILRQAVIALRKARGEK